MICSKWSLVGSIVFKKNKMKKIEPYTLKDMVSWNYEY